MAEKPPPLQPSPMQDWYTEAALGSPSEAPVAGVRPEDEPIEVEPIIEEEHEGRLEQAGGFVDAEIQALVEAATANIERQADPDAWTRLRKKVMSRVTATALAVATFAVLGGPATKAEAGERGRRGARVAAEITRDAAYMLQEEVYRSEQNLVDADGAWRNVEGEAEGLVGHFRELERVALEIERNIPALEKAGNTMGLRDAMEQIGHIRVQQERLRDEMRRLGSRQRQIEDYAEKEGKTLKKKQVGAAATRGISRILDVIGRPRY